jgi:prepilin-type processing-associated H-X9-DG protein
MNRSSAARTTRGRFRLTRMLVIAAVMTVLAWAAYRVSLSRAMQRESMAMCERNLAYFDLALKSYSYNVKFGDYEIYPPLSDSPGQLMFDADAVFPLLGNLAPSLVSYAHPDAAALLKTKEADYKSLIDNHSYWYLGYYIPTIRSLDAFIEVYRFALVHDFPIPQRNEVWPDEERAIEELLGKDWRSKHEQRVDLRDVDDERRVLSACPSGIPVAKRNVRLRIQWGLVFAFTEYSWEIDQINATIPVLIERPELHGDGGHVLFFDGHVEFIPYPGKFPMTEQYIAGLRELDALDSTGRTN